jgi:hypothetical protein
MLAIKIPSLNAGDESSIFLLGLLALGDIFQHMDGAKFVSAVSVNVEVEARKYPCNQGSGESASPAIPHNKGNVKCNIAGAEKIIYGAAHKPAFSRPTD